MMKGDNMLIPNLFQVWHKALILSENKHVLYLFSKIAIKAKKKKKFMMAVRSVTFRKEYNMFPDTWRS